MSEATSARGILHSVLVDSFATASLSLGTIRYDIVCLEHSSILMVYYCNDAVASFCEQGLKQEVVSGKKCPTTIKKGASEKKADSYSPVFVLFMYYVV